MDIEGRSDPVEDMKGCLHEMISQWHHWTPGDTRGSSEYATIEAMKEAVDVAGFVYITPEL